MHDECAGSSVIFKHDIGAFDPVEPMADVMFFLNCMGVCVVRLTHVCATPCRSMCFWHALEDFALACHWMQVAELLADSFVSSAMLCHIKSCL